MPAISREQRQANLTAIYGPEGVRSSCPTCGHSPRVARVGDVL